MGGMSSLGSVVAPQTTPQVTPQYNQPQITPGMQSLIAQNASFNPNGANNVNIPMSQMIDPNAMAAYNATPQPTIDNQPIPDVGGKQLPVLGQPQIQPMNPNMPQRFNNNFGIQNRPTGSWNGHSFSQNQQSRPQQLAEALRKGA